MRRVKEILHLLLWPPRWVLAGVVPASFAVLIAVFVLQVTHGAAAYAAYALSAYSLTVLVVALPRLAVRAQRAFADAKATLAGTALVRRLSSNEHVGRYLADGDFREGVGVCRGMAANLAYALGCAGMGVCFASAWFGSLSLYYLGLGALRAYLARSWRRGGDDQLRCYRTTASLLFVLNLPMGVVIWQMVRANHGFSYPGYTVYLFALYTFYSVGLAVVNLVRSRALASPAVAAAKALNFVAAAMSVLGLQTVMIVRFSTEGEGFRLMMNSITGAGVYVTVIATAVWMLLRCGKRGKAACGKEDRVE